MRIDPSFIVFAKSTNTYYLTLDVSNGDAFLMKDVTSFLTKYQQNAEMIDSDRFITALLLDMEAGLENRPSGMEMNLSYLSPVIRTLPNYKVIVMDAGGTHFRSGLATTDDYGKFALCLVRTISMPGSGIALSKTRFFDAVAATIEDIADAAERIGFCFSYSVDMTPEIDGKLTDWAKEINAPEVIGSCIGASTLDAMHQYSDTPHQIVLLNDTVATLLGGMHSQSIERYSGVVGFVFGTGINVSYAERCVNIKKLQNPFAFDQMIINTECGNYNGFPQGTFDQWVDLSSMNPGKAKAEKMTSGKYLADIIALAIQQAILDQLFIGKIGSFDLHDISLPLINEFLIDPAGSDNYLTKAFHDIKDRESVASIANALIDRAAKIGAIMIAAAILKTTRDKEDARPIAVFAEGTTFHKLKGYQEAFSHHLRTLLMKHNIAFEIFMGSDWNLLGAAIAAMSN